MKRSACLRHCRHSAAVDEHDADDTLPLEGQSHMAANQVRANVRLAPIPERILASSRSRHGFPTLSARSSLTRSGMTDFTFVSANLERCRTDFTFVSANLQRWRLAEAAKEVRHSRPRERVRSTSGECRESMPLPVRKSKAVRNRRPPRLARKPYAIALTSIPPLKGPSRGGIPLALLAEAWVFG
jgi:hypothetical protein